MGRFVAALALVVALAGCSGEFTEADMADGKYISDVEARGVPTGVTNGTAGAQLGHAVCSDLDAGSRADAKVLQVANLQQGNVDEFTTAQAEVIVYWSGHGVVPEIPWAVARELAGRKLVGDLVLTCVQRRV